VLLSQHRSGRFSCRTLSRASVVKVANRPRADPTDAIISLTRHSKSLPTGDLIEAWIYIATKPNVTLRLRPYTWYKRFLVEGAKEHLLPVEYISELQGIEAINDSDPKRHEERWALICASSTD
jgi:hypothetical protein